MRRIKRRIFAGAVCEQIVYNIASGRPAKTAKPRLRFQNEEERRQHRDGIARRRAVRLVNENFGPDSLYVTLTFDVHNEVHSAAECRRERDNFIRRLLRRYPAAKIFCVYGQGQHTQRFHLHMLSSGIPEEALGKIWGRGSVFRADRLRAHNYYDGIDHGRDYTGLVNYLLDHWRPEFGGHRYKATRSCREPVPEPPTEAVREYSPEHPPIAPRGYTYVSAKITRFGYQLYKYVKIDDPGGCGRRKSLVNV